VSGTAGDGGEKPKHKQRAAKAETKPKYLTPAALARFLGALEGSRGVPAVARALQATGTEEGTSGTNTTARRKAKRARRSSKKEG
jgi:hypothetical protein